MPLFRYQAVNLEGKKIAGVIDAESLVAVKEKLRKNQIMVTALEALTEKTKKIILKPDLLLGFTREMGQLLRSGLPLYESLLTIEEKYRSHSSHPLFLDLCDRLKEGASLSDLLKNYPESFDSIYLSMVSAAEQTASLPEIFEQLTLLISKQQKLKKQLVSALAYPGFLGGFCFLIVIALLFFVIPSMQELFEGRSLHPLTAVVLGVSKWVNANALYLAIAILCCSSSFIFSLRTQKGRFFCHSLLSKMPLLKTIILEAALVRFCRSSALLLQGGVPLLEALNYSRKVMRHLVLEKAIEKAEKKMMEGKRLSDELKNCSLIPTLVIRMLSIAEESGKITNAFQNLAEIFEDDMERNLGRLTTFLQPLLLMILGGIIGLVVLSILIPLTDVNSFLST